MAAKPFKIRPHDRLDKLVEIEGPELVLFVDYDDVDQKVVSRQMKKMVAILNENWRSDEPGNSKGTS